MSNLMTHTERAERVRRGGGLEPSVYVPAPSPPPPVKDAGIGGSTRRLEDLTFGDIPVRLAFRDFGAWIQEWLAGA